MIHYARIMPKFKRIFLEIIIIIIALGFLYFIMKPSAKPKSKQQKQQEIYVAYKRKLDSNLSGIDDRTILIKKKTALLKSFSAELHRNLFFDEDEVRELIEKLAKYEVKSGK